MNLQPVDFKAVAAKGCFVYCYLRADGRPYYVGIASTAVRPFERHGCGVPRKTPERVRLMRSELTWEEAGRWEQFYIARYGRKDVGTGILRNRTDGGDGILGYVHTEEAKRRIRQNNKKESYPHLVGRPVSAETRKAIADAQRGKIIPLEQIEKIKAARAKQVITKAHKEAISASLKGRKLSTEHIEALKAGNRKPEKLAKRAENTAKAWTNPDAKAARSRSISLAKASANAALCGCTPEQWLEIPRHQRSKLIAAAKAA